MELILLRNVKGLGSLGDKVSVKPGYGRNYLVPQGMALPATKQNIEVFEQRRAELEAAAEERKAAAKARQEAIDGQTITVLANASGEGKLYGSVGTREIAAALTDNGYSVDKSEIDLPEGAFRNVGEYEVTLHLYAETDATIKLIVVGDETGDAPVGGVTTAPQEVAERAIAESEAAEAEAAEAEARAKAEAAAAEAEAQAKAEAEAAAEAAEGEEAESEEEPSEDK